MHEIPGLTGRREESWKKARKEKGESEAKTTRNLDVAAQFHLPPPPTS